MPPHNGLRYMIIMILFKHYYNPLYTAYGNWYAARFGVQSLSPLPKIDD